MKNRKQKSNYKELKGKLSETRKIDSLSKTTGKSTKTELKSIKRANKNPKGTRFLKNSNNNILELKNVRKIYVTGSMKYTALKNISLEIQKGDFVVILGASGSGKTSLLNIISGLDRPTSGDVIVDDLNISALKNSELTTFRRNKIGFIFQSYNLLLELNAIENALIGQKLQTENKLRLDVNELFKRVGMQGMEKKLLSELSGGQLQRVSVMRALSKNPKIICADEPTGALDSKTSGKIMDLFKEINARYKTTIILVTHNDSYTKYANKVIRVIDGNVSVQTQ